MTLKIFGVIVFDLNSIIIEVLNLIKFKDYIAEINIISLKFYPVFGMYLRHFKPFIGYVKFKIIIVIIFPLLLFNIRPQRNSSFYYPHCY